MFAGMSGSALTEAGGLGVVEVEMMEKAYIVLNSVLQLLQFPQLNYWSDNSPNYPFSSLWCYSKRKLVNYF